MSYRLIIPQDTKEDIDISCLGNVKAQQYLIIDLGEEYKEVKKFPHSKFSISL